MWRKLKGYWPNSFKKVASRKPLISDATWMETGLSLLGNDKDWTLEQLWKKIMWADESRFILFQSDGAQ